MTIPLHILNLLVMFQVDKCVCKKIRWMLLQLSMHEVFILLFFPHNTILIKNSEVQRFSFSVESKFLQMEYQNKCYFAWKYDSSLHVPLTNEIIYIDFAKMLITMIIIHVSARGKGFSRFPVRCKLWFKL